MSAVESHRMGDQKRNRTNRRKPRYELKLRTKIVEIEFQNKTKILLQFIRFVTVFLILRRTVDPIIFVTLRQYFEFFEQYGQLPRVRNEMYQIGFRFTRPVVYQVYNILRVSNFADGCRFSVRFYIDIPSKKSLCA